MSWLLNLGFAGGNKNPDHGQHWLYVRPVKETFFVRLDNSMPERIYADEDATTRIYVDWTDWLAGTTISSVSWSEDTGAVTFSNSTNTNQVATTYVTTTSGTINREYRLECKVTTAESPARVYPYSLMLFVTRTP